MSAERDQAWEYERPEYGSVEAEAEGGWTPMAQQSPATLPMPRTGDTPSADSGEALPAQRAEGDATAPPTADLGGHAAPEPEPGADISVSAPADDATWQLSTDMAPLPPLRQ